MRHCALKRLTRRSGFARPCKSVDRRYYPCANTLRLSVGVSRFRISRLCTTASVNPEPYCTIRTHQLRVHPIMRPLAILTALFTLATADITARASTPCNNSPDLCGRSYSSITHFGAHDSPFVRDATTGDSVSGNQYYNSTVQLDAGVRLLSAQVHKQNNDWHLCHSSCNLLDAGLLSSWLRKIKIWLDSNPDDVVTVLLVNSDNATPAQLHSEFVAANITSYAFKPPSPSIPPSWPTLQTLISANTRLMVFVASLPNRSSIPADQAYLMDEFTFIFENPFQNNAPASFTCIPDRPTPVRGQTQIAVNSGRMPLMNHFLYRTGVLDIDTPDIGNITLTNSPGSSVTGQLGKSLADCKSAYGKAPTFVLVDFFDQGPAIDAIDAINGITPVGRKAVPVRDTQTTRAESTFAGVKALVEQIRSGLGGNITRADWIWAAGKWSLGGVNIKTGKFT